MLAVARVTQRADAEHPVIDEVADEDGVPVGVWVWRQRLKQTLDVAVNVTDDEHGQFAGRHATILERKVMELVVIGGGQVGVYHARQLLKSVPRAQVTVVDRDPSCPAFVDLGSSIRPVVMEWLPFLRTWLLAGGDEDRLVPAPIAPHLTWEWLGLELGAEPVDPPRSWGLPYEQPGRGRELFLSAAAWRCPATCIEPAHCPMLHAPRDWDLGDIIEARAQSLGYVPSVLRCLHFAGGVGAISVGDLRAARDRLRSAPAGAVALVALSSRCHAAVGALGLG